jgi:hypothetical protein
VQPPAARLQAFLAAGNLFREVDDGDRVEVGTRVGHACTIAPEGVSPTP